MLEISRIYKNSTDDTIRIDSITMIPTTSVLATGAAQRTYRRNVKTEVILEDSGDRQVYVISIVTSADSWESAVSAPANYNWVAWSGYGGVRCNMSDLPQIGDLV